MLVVLRNLAVKAHRKVTQVVQPMEPMSMNNLRPKRSTVRAATVLARMVKVVQQALRRRGRKPARPREA